MNLSESYKNRLQELANISGKKQYIGQCDALRRKCDVNEEYWHAMMTNKKEISVDQFLQNVDMSKLIDIGETPESYVDEAMRQDPGGGVFISRWGDEECMFLQTAGFEFIFV